jgi:CheY-like chemotaxis protein
MNNNKNIATPVTILLVDNEPDSISVLSMGLEDGGFKVNAFNDPISALSNFKPNFYALSILDINMPKMDGYQLCKEIRKIEGLLIYQTKH